MGQRSIPFQDTIRERRNGLVEHEIADNRARPRLRTTADPRTD